MANCGLCAASSWSSPAGPTVSTRQCARKKRRKRNNPMPAPTLTTARLVLRQLREDDAAALFPVLSDPEVMTWWSSGPHASLAETADYVKGNAAEGQGYDCWAITAGDDVALGWVILIDGKPDVKE